MKNKIKAELGDKINDEKLDIITDYIKEPPKVTLIESAAGTGKTSLLVALARTIKSINGEDNKCLALAHTVASTEEIIERTKDMDMVQASTIHSLCRKGIIEHGSSLAVTPTQYLIQEPWAINPEFTILTDGAAGTDDAYEKIIDILKSLDTEDVFNENTIKVIYKAYVEAVKNDLPVEQELKKVIRQDANYKSAIKLLKRFERYKRDNHVLEHHDCLIRILALAKEHPKELQKMLEGYVYLFLDEFQDNNKHQYRLIVHMIEHVPHTVAVGDPAQGIFLYAGAIKDIFPEMRKQFPDLKTYRLVNNHRSTTEILALANHVRGQLGEKDVIQLKSEQGLSGPKPQIIGLKIKLFDWLRGEIDSLLQRGFKPKDIAILCRSTRICKSTNDCKHPEATVAVKVLSDLKVNYCLRPKKQILLERYHKFMLHALWFMASIYLVRNFRELLELVFHLEKEEAKSITRKLLGVGVCEKVEINNFYSCICDIEKLGAKEKPRMLRKLYLQYFRGEGLPHDFRVFNLWLFIHRAMVTNLDDAEESYFWFFNQRENKACVSTVHSFKGSEAKVVFFLGLDSAKYRPNIAHKVANIRLVYTGVTRAMKILYLVYDEKVAEKYPSRLAPYLEGAVKEGIVDFKVV